MKKQAFIFSGLAIFFLLTTCVAGWFLYSKTANFNALQGENTKLQNENADLKGRLWKIEGVLPELYPNENIFVLISKPDPEHWGLPVWYILDMKEIVGDPEYERIFRENEPYGEEILRQYKACQHTIDIITEALQY